MKLSELAERTGARVEGATDDVDIVGAAGLDEAGEGQVTFLANPRYTPRVNSTRASAIYLSEDAQTDRQIAILRVKDPYLAYTRALRIFNPEAELEPFIHPSAVIDPTARMAKRVAIGACVVIGRNVVHRRRRSYPSERHDLRRRHDRKRLSHTFRRRDSRTHRHRRASCDPQQLGDRLRWFWLRERRREALAEDSASRPSRDRRRRRDRRGDDDRSCVSWREPDRAWIEADNLVQIGHSCTVGEDTLLCAQVGLAGSSHIGNRVILAGQAGVAGHLTIGDDVVLTAKSATSHDIPAGKIISGIPAFDNKDWLRSTAAFRRLGEMQRTLRELGTKN